MKRLLACTLFSMVFLCATVCAKTEKAKPQTNKPLAKPESVNDQASYIIGHNMGERLKSDDVPVNFDYLVKGLTDGLAGTGSMLTDEEVQTAMSEFQQNLQAKMAAKQELAGEKNKAEGEAFLAANKDKAGVKVLASGLQYEILKEGDGPKPAETDTVTVHYTGTLIDGTKFDSSVDRGQPATFPLNGVIKGWTEGVQLMKTGSKFKFYIPADLAYGERGAGQVIGPHATLIFDVELISIEGK